MKKITRIALTFSILLTLILVSCTGVQYDGDILYDLNQDTSSTVYFKKDADSPVAFALHYKIGNNYSIADLPGKESDVVSELNPGYIFTGWKPESLEGVDESVLTVDSEGYIQTFHMTTSDFTVYGTWTLPEPEIQIIIEASGSGEIGVTYSLSGGNLTLSVELPEDADESDYTYTWFYPEDGLTNPLSTNSSFTINTSSWVSGYYQISLIAVRTSDGMPSGKTVQIHVE